ncbi:MAG: hypothetical protein AB8B55_05365 [Mariniblastus sp.]
MPLTRLFGFVLAVTMVTLFASDSFAQVMRPGQAVLRILGQGYGNGYHQCNPGPNPDYYNPYTTQNTFLVSRSPQYLNGMQADLSTMQRLQQGTFHRGTPFSVYAAPRSQSTYQPYQGQTIESSFEPLDLDESKSRKTDNREMEKDGKAADDSAFVPGHIEALPVGANSRSNGFSQTGFRVQNQQAVDQATPILPQTQSRTSGVIDIEANQFNPFGGEN